MNLTEAVIMRAVALASERVGPREISRNSDHGGPIDSWVRRIGLDPAGRHAWCVAGAWCCIDDACIEFGAVNPLPKTGKVIRLWERTPAIFKTATPYVGAIACRVSNLEDPNSPGHCGIVEAIPQGDSRIHMIEFNTNAAGSREGTECARQKRPHGYWNLGFIMLAPPGPMIPPVRG